MISMKSKIKKVIYSILALQRIRYTILENPHSNSILLQLNLKLSILQLLSSNLKSQQLKQRAPQFLKYSSIVKKVLAISTLSSLLIQGLLKMKMKKKTPRMERKDLLVWFHSILKPKQLNHDFQLIRKRRLMVRITWHSANGQCRLKTHLQT
jgi:hypothetical protein